MLVLAIGVALALLIPLLTGGSYARLLGSRWRWGALLFLGVGIQIGLEFSSLIPKDHWYDVGYGLLVASYALILLFCARNLLLTGMSLVLIGVACNAAVITADQGMPVKLPPEWRHQSWARATIKHHPRDHDDKLVFLSDVIVLRSPFDNVLSFGDLIIMVGLCDVAFNGSRKPRRRRRPAASAPAEIDLVREAGERPSGDGDEPAVDRAPERGDHPLVAHAPGG